MRKTIIISVISDLVTDQRVHRTAMTFTRQGHRVVLVGRKLKNSLPLGSRRYRYFRFKLWFEKGFWFYAIYNIRLFFYLMFKHVDILFANDLDTLPANALAGLLKNVPIIYDSHEYFTGVPEIINRPFVRNTWKAFEKIIFPRLKYIITVNDSIAELYENEYEKKISVIRNIPDVPLIAVPYDNEKTKKELGISPDKKIILLQGAGINVERGAEEAVEAMKLIDNAVLLIIGAGDVLPFLKEAVKQNQLNGKIIFKDKMPYEQLLQFTHVADIGLTLDKDTNFNYRFSLPNKLFDYIHAGVPVLASPVVEVKKIIEKYQIGVLIENHNPEHIAQKIKFMLADEQRIKLWKQNISKAVRELNWSNEEKKLLDLLHELF